MTCRVACGSAVNLLDLYLDLASSGRRDDFRWFARSQGVAAEDIERLWQRALEAILARRDLSHAARGRRSSSSL